MEHWKILHSRNVFAHRWYNLRQDCVQLPDGAIVDDYFVSVRHDVVVIFALTPDGRIPLVRQYKHGVQKILLELPGGFIDVGEDPAQAAARELLEETGCVADEFHLLSQVHDNPTKDTTTLHLYLARNARQVQAQRLDRTEQITVEQVALDQLQRLVVERQIEVSNSIATIFLALAYLKRLN